MKKIVIITDCIDVAANEIRGAIYSNCTANDVVIEPIVLASNYSVVNAAFLIKLIAEIYPPETIINVILNPIKERTERIIGRTKKKNLIFEGTNTGVFSWLLEDFGCEEIYELFDPGFVPFGGKYVHAPAVGKAASGISLDKLGEKFPVEKIRSANIVEGTVLHIDNFGNLKIYHKFDKNTKNGDRFEVIINDKSYKMIFNKRMMELDDGSLVIYPGSSFGYTEIGLVRGNAQEALKVKLGEVIKIRKL